MKNNIEDEALKGNISEEDKKTITDKCNRTIFWLENN